MIIHSSQMTFGDSDGESVTKTTTYEKVLPWWMELQFMMTLYHVPTPKGGSFN
jgi:hypothetical protein